MPRTGPVHLASLSNIPPMPLFWYSERTASGATANYTKIVFEISSIAENISKDDWDSYTSDENLAIQLFTHLRCIKFT